MVVIWCLLLVVVSCYLMLSLWLLSVGVYCVVCYVVVSVCVLCVYGCVSMVFTDVYSWVSDVLPLCLVFLVTML